MNLRSFLYFFALATIFATSSAQDEVNQAPLEEADDSGGFNFGDFISGATDVISSVSNNLEPVDCAEDVRAASACSLAPFSGTYVCRKYFSLFGKESVHTQCVRDVVQGFTLGVKGDTCGPCNALKDPCECTCGEEGTGRVEVDFHVWGFIRFTRCMTAGWSRHAVNWGNAANCNTACLSGAAEEGGDM